MLSRWRIPALSALIIGIVVLSGCGEPPQGAASDGPVVAVDSSSMPVTLPPAAAGGFTDVTHAAGIHARQTLPGDDLENIIDAVGAGAAFADLDEDGWLDLVVLGGPASPADPQGTYHAGLRLYRNQGNGRFIDATADSGIPTASTGLALAIADADGDGLRDLYLVDRGPNHLFRNLGGLHFEDVTSTAGVGSAGFGVGATFLDIDGDRDLDLYVANYLVYEGQETAHFAPDGYPGPLSYRAEADVLYRNIGGGRFEDVSAASGVAGLSGRGMSLAAADFDEDGDSDLFVANDATENFLLLNDGNGHFVENGVMAGVALGENSEQTSAMTATVGDVDGDGHLDLAVSDTAFGALYRFESAGLFSDRVMASGIGMLSGQYVSWGQNLFDFDNDGRLDLFLANGDLHHLVGWEDLLLRNAGSGRFEDATATGGPYFLTRRMSRGSIVGDYDNDGDLDIFVTTLQDEPILLRNDLEEGAGWIGIELVGREARDPFGARVEIEVNGHRQVAEYRCPTSYLGQSDPRLHFGLGEGVTTVDRVLIIWPGGDRHSLTQVPAGRFLRIKEGPP